MMNKSFLKNSALLAGLSVVSYSAAANNFGLVFAGQGGFHVMNSASLEKFKAKDKVSLFTAGKLKEKGKEVELTEAQAEAENKFIAGAESEMNFNWEAGVRGSYDHGDDNDEMFGAEFGVGYFSASHTASFKDESTSTTPAATGNDANTPAATTAGADATTKLVTGVSLSGISIDASFRIIPFNFDGGKVYITLGADSRLNLLGKDFISAKRANATDKDKKHETLLGEDAEKKAAREAISSYNVAFRFGAFANFANDFINVGVVGRWWLVDQVERSSDAIKVQDSAISNLSAGKGLDASLNLGLNLAPMFA